MQTTYQITHQPTGRVVHLDIVSFDNAVSYAFIAADVREQPLAIEARDEWPSGRVSFRTIGVANPSQSFMDLESDI